MLDYNKGFHTLLELWEEYQFQAIQWGAAKGSPIKLNANEQKIQNRCNTGENFGDHTKLLFD
jgi:hypothetical protein